MRAREHDTDQSLKKADFADIYGSPDPRPYYRRLGALEYQVPHHGQRVFREVLQALDTTPATVVDLCCSYGVNAALLKHDLTLDDLYGRYCSSAVADLATGELAAADRDFYAEHRRRDAPQVVGVDAAAPAVEYAVEVGLLGVGAAEDLEQREPSHRLAEAVGDAELITVTGGVGYITEQTVARLIDCTSADRRPWFAALCLRTVSYDGVADALAQRGLVTEQLADVTFPQRRFADEKERDYALRELAARGLDPAGKESEGAYHANVYLSRPADEVAKRPIEAVLDRIG